MNIVIATDAWSPQVNGVVRTLQTTAGELERLGHRLLVIEPSLFRTWSVPFYPEIRLASNANGRRLKQLIGPFLPAAVHIATEGPVGLAVRRFCRLTRLPFTTSYHTNFPDYFRDYLWMPRSLSYAILRAIHRPAARVMVSTNSMRQKLRMHGFKNEIAIWSRGVDTTLFRPQPQLRAAGPPRFLYVGRVAIEKNLRAFLQCRLDGEKWIVGDGPARLQMQREFPTARFFGQLHGEDLAAIYAQASVFVFPSKTDTFGLVMLEALACGIPVAAFPVPGPLDILDGRELVGCLADDLEQAIRNAHSQSAPEACRALALEYSWSRCTRQFIENLAPPVCTTSPRDRARTVTTKQPTWAACAMPRPAE